ncbi:ABC transporter substrate-binding protein [Motilimonas pumila]|uniref:ABC transporter substrate-binding protein n=1 Tax=Motilimonas pumila TaxID=2303987 RepID=A0A418YDF0_9GAMM|nr:ABC transporter substrate-binding protein [Motilimonas pumila]RJG42531.1 ABC transporter substrate-binding protein [Motilimonas pumila]
MLAKITKVSAALLLGMTALVSPAKAADQVSLTIVSEFRPLWKRNFNPFLATDRLPTTMQFIYEPLVVFNEMKGGEPTYRLATKHYFSDDLKSLFFELREDVKWSDGTEFTADDVVYSLTQASKGGTADVQGLAGHIQSVHRLGKYKVEIKLKQVNTGIDTQIVRAPIVPRHIFSAVEDITTFENLEPVGTGPFTEIEVFSWQVYTQCRNPHYYDNNNLAIDCLKNPIIQNNRQLLAAAIKGRLDWTSSFIPNIEEVLLSKNASTRYWFPAAGSASFMVNFKTPNVDNRKAFNDINFRRAFSMAMDRKKIVDEAGAGYWSVNEYPSGLGDQFEAWADPAVKANYGKFNTFDINGAQILLSTSGYRDIDGDGFVENPDGSPIKFEILVPKGWSDHIQTVEIGIEGLTKIGINASITTPDFGVLNEQIKSAEFDAAFTNYFAGANPYRYYYTAFHSEQMDKARFGGHHFVDKELDALIDSFNKTAVESERVAIMHQIENFIGSRQITMPVFSSNFNFQYDDVSFKGWFSADNPKAIPVVWPDTPERLLHVLDIEPVSTQ